MLRWCHCQSSENASNFTLRVKSEVPRRERELFTYKRTSHPFIPTDKLDPYVDSSQTTLIYANLESLDLIPLSNQLKKWSTYYVKVFVLDEQEVHLYTITPLSLGEEELLHTSISLIHPIYKLHLYRIFVKSSQMISNTLIWSL